MSGSDEERTRGRGRGQGRGKGRGGRRGGRVFRARQYEEGEEERLEMLHQERSEKADVIFIYKFILLPLDVV